MLRHESDMLNSCNQLCIQWFQQENVCVNGVSETDGLYYPLTSVHSFLHIARCGIVLARYIDWSSWVQANRWCITWKRVDCKLICVLFAGTFWWTGWRKWPPSSSLTVWRCTLPSVSSIGFWSDSGWLARDFSCLVLRRWSSARGLLRIIRLHDQCLLFPHTVWIKKITSSLRFSEIFFTDCREF